MLKSMDFLIKSSVGISLEKSKSSIKKDSLSKHFWLFNLNVYSFKLEFTVQIMRDTANTFQHCVEIFSSLCLDL